MLVESRFTYLTRARAEAAALFTHSHLYTSRARLKVCLSAWIPSQTVKKEHAKQRLNKCY